MYDFIFFITNRCNYRCSYCDVLKGKDDASDTVISDVISFVSKNSENIASFKFFGGEPLLNKKGIKTIIERTSLSGKFHLVTNTSLLDDEMKDIFNREFFRIFYSVDSENKENLDNVIASNRDLKDKLYVNLIIDPDNVLKSYMNFEYLYKFGIKNYNILPVYHTKIWHKNSLVLLSKFMKKILDLSLKDKEIKLFGFQENDGYETNLFNNVIFVDVDGKVYFSDIVTTIEGKSLKDDLYIGEIKQLTLDEIKAFDYSKARKKIDELEDEINGRVRGQKELHKLMDYFSKYLNYKKENGK